MKRAGKKTATSPAVADAMERGIVDDHDHHDDHRDDDRYRKRSARRPGSCGSSAGGSMQLDAASPDVDALPGAFAIPGGDDGSTAQEEGIAEGGDGPALEPPAAEAAMAPFVAVAYVVQESDDGAGETAAAAARGSSSEEQIRREIIASAAQAIDVTPMDVLHDEEHTPPKSWRERKWTTGRRTLLLVLLVVLVAAISVGIAVPLSAQSESGNSDRDASVLASVNGYGFHDGGFAGAVYAETRTSLLFEGGATTSGYAGVVMCKVRPCLETINGTPPACALDEVYQPGCCLPGDECSANQTLCGERCPLPPESCSLTQPENATCTQAGCYTCKQVDGEDFYHLYDYIFDVDCLNVGTAVRPENGETYKWAIVCGPLAPGDGRNNHTLDYEYGAYRCTAFRSGAGLTDESGGIHAPGELCRSIALAECGCGPPGMNTFGWQAPTEPCTSEGRCRFKCEDSGRAQARNLCRAFPGDIAWWEGKNAFNKPLFEENVFDGKYELDIYEKR
jgi:hypothetical protein